MTTLTAANTYADSGNGPTPGTPRTAASVNDPLQTLLNNTLALANGYGKRRGFSVNSSATVTDITEQYVMGDAPLGDTYPTASFTLQFAASAAVTHSWKKVHLERIDQGSIITFQTNTPYATFLIWTAPANMSDVWMTFHRVSTSVWTLVSIEHSGSIFEIDVTAAGTYAVEGNPKEVHVFNNAFGVLPAGTTNIDLEGDYLRGDAVTIYVRGIAAATSVAIRNSTSTTLHTLTMARDGSDSVVRMRYHDTYGWKAIDTHAGTRGQSSNLFLDHAAVNGSIDPAVPHHTITGLVSGTITMTVADGTFIGQRVTISADQQSQNASVRVVFKGYGSASSLYLTGDLRVSTSVSPYAYGFSACELLWNGSRWFVLNRTI